MSVSNVILKAPSPMYRVSLTAVRISFMRSLSSDISSNSSSAVWSPSTAMSISARDRLARVSTISAGTPVCIFLISWPGDALAAQNFMESAPELICS